MNLVAYWKEMPGKLDRSNHKQGQLLPLIFLSMWGIVFVYLKISDVITIQSQWAKQEPVGRASQRNNTAYSVKLHDQEAKQAGKLSLAAEHLFNHCPA